MPSPNTRDGSGASGLALAEPSPGWSDLNRRVASALVLLPLTIFCVWAGDYAFLLLVCIACVLLAVEWVTLCGYAPLDLPMLWMPVILVTAAICAGSGEARIGLLIVLTGTIVAAISGERSARGPWEDVGDASGAASVGSVAGRGTALAAREGTGSLPGHGSDRSRRLNRAGSGVNDPIHPEAHTTVIAPLSPSSLVPGPGPVTTGGSAEPHRAETDGPVKPGHDGVGGFGAFIGNGWTRSRFDFAFGLVYLGLAAVAVAWLRADPNAGLANTLFVLSIVWASDVCAYLAGRLIGGARLAPAISPGKTWSGAIGGLAGALLAGLAVAACVSSEFSSSHVIELAIGLGIVSQLGDLLESALKRRFGVKDSGSIIPGHGGLLDRLDALLAVAPVAALLAFSVGRGVVLWR